MTQVKWRPLFWTSFHKVSTVITAYTRETKDELYQDLESSDPRDSVDRELADFAQKKKKKKRSCLSGAGGSCQILQYVQHMTPLYIWRSDWHRKNLGLGLGGQQQREIFPFWGKKTNNSHICRVQKSSRITVQRVHSEALHQNRLRDNDIVLETSYIGMNKQSVA